MNAPIVSIVIPALNEQKYIGLCLKAIRQIDYPQELIEIIVVDNGSTDNTVKIAQSYGCNVELLPNVTIAALRNKGAHIAKGEVLAFIDADCIPQKDWIKNACNKLEGPHVGLVGYAQFLMPEHCSWVERIWKSQRKKTEGYVDWVGSGNMFIKKSVFEQSNGFNESIATSEDCDLCFRLTKNGLKIISSSNVAVIHCKFRKTLKDFFKKEIWHGKGVLRTFLTCRSKFTNFKSLAFALLYAVSMITIPISIILGVLFNNYTPLIIFIFLAITPPFLVAIKKSRSVNTVTALALLYFLYGIARATCIFNINNWLSRKEE